MTRRCGPGWLRLPAHMVSLLTSSKESFVPVPRLSLKKIVAVSDSLTNEEPDNYLALLGARLQVSVVANAFGGWTTTSFFRDRFKDIAFAKIPHDADLFLLLLGSNNQFEAAGGTEASIADAVAGVQKLAAHLLTFSPTAQFLLVAPPTVILEKNVLPTPLPVRRIDRQSPAILAQLSQAYRALAQARQWLFVDLYPVLGADDFMDACHPNPAGNRKIVEVIAPVLEQAFTFPR
jgi:lysophospholipase L1-like esterase